MIILNINWLCGGAWYLGQQFWTEHNSYCFGARRKDYFFILMDILLEVCKVMMSWLFVYIAVELDENPHFYIWNIAYSSIKYFIPI